MDDRVRGNHVPRDKTACALHECAARVILGQGRVVFCEIGVDLAHRVKGLARQCLTFGTGPFQRLRPQEIFQQAATVFGQFCAGVFDQRLQPDMARIMYGVQLGIYDIADIAHFGVGKLKAHASLLELSINSVWR